MKLEPLGGIFSKMDDVLSELGDIIEEEKAFLSALEEYVCPKNNYDSKPEALSVATRRQRATGISLRAYLCDKCGYFHLTKTVERRKRQ